MTVMFALMPILCLPTLVAKAIKRPAYLPSTVRHELKNTLNAGLARLARSEETLTSCPLVLTSPGGVQALMAKEPVMQML